MNTKSLNFALMQINDQTHKQQKEYEDLKTSEVQEKIDVDQKARDKTRKDAAAKKREKKKQLTALEKAYKQAQDHLDAVKTRMQEDEPQALLTYNPNAKGSEEGCGDEGFGGDAMVLEEADDEGFGCDPKSFYETDFEEEAHANEAMVNAKNALDAFKAAMSDEDDEDEEDDDDAKDKDKGKGKPARKERTEAEKAETLKKTRETWKKKAEAKEKEDKETQDKLAAAEKLKTQNTTLTKSLEDVVKEKEKVQEEYQATHATILELQVLKEAWLKENLETDKLQAMKAWYAPPPKTISACLFCTTFVRLLLAGCAT